MPESLARMPFSQVSHLLEILSWNGITDQLARRFRLDPEFAEKVSQLIIAEYLENPGVRYAIEFDKSKTRKQLVKELRESRRFMTLRDDIIRDIEPKSSDQESLFTGQPTETIEVFLVNLFTDTTEKKATALLDEMGLESVTLEEAITFADQRNEALTQDYSIVVLAAKYFNPKEKKYSFFDLGVTMAGDWTMGLTEFKFRSGTRFLVKRKKSSPTE